MKKWLALYGGWVLGVLSAAALAYWYWVQTYGEATEEDGSTE